MKNTILEKIRRAWFCTVQFLTIPANQFLSWLLRLSIHRPANLHIESGTLIIANHQSMMDPFLVSYHIGVRNWTKIVPLRYPVTHEYMDKKFITWFIQLMGGYNIGDTPLQRLRGLALTRALLKEGYSVVIFPEGKINRTKQEVEAFQRGVEMLFSYDYPVVFARLTHLNAPDRFQFWKLKPRPIIEYSRLFPRHSSKTDKINHMLHFFDINT